VEPQIGKQLFEVQIGVEVFKLLVSDESTNRTHFVMYPPLGFHELARAEILDGILKFTTENITDEHSVASLFKTLFDTRHETQEVLQLMFGSYPPHFEHEFVGAPLGDREFIFAHKEKELFIVSSAKNLILRRFELRRQSGRDVLVIGRWLSDSELQLQLPTLNESVSLRLLKGFWCAGVS
jgi:hypothetical protein